jgi:hypothetical protein
MANGHLSGHMAAAPSTSPWAKASRQRSDPCEGDCTPRCPACGGLNCSCRPRFFPGQLLTDRELNGLEQYVVDKNRLHNRYLHGWGVACGLEVTCDNCDSGHVVVRSGYAVAPCGDDIVLCSDQSVDVCALINACEPRPNDCDPYDQPARDCAGGEKDWVLAVCYDERPVRGITAQLGAGDSPGCGSCRCGGSRGCGCNGERTSGGEHGSGCNCGSSAAGRTTAVRGHKPQCEPTQICEGYRFVVYPLPKAGRGPVPGGDNQRDYLWAWLYANRSKFGPLIDRVLCCATKAMELRQSIREGATLTGAAGLAIYTDYAEALAELADDFASQRCSFVKEARDLRDQARVARISASGGGARAAAITQLDLSSRVRALDDLWLQIVSECVCSALLPACPPPATTNCVPLAVDPDDDCRIVDICNWSQRRILITWPTVTYWLSWLPWGRLLSWVQKLCCGTEGGRDAYLLLALMFNSIFSQGATRTKAAAFVAEAPAMGEAAMHEAGEPSAKAADKDPLDAAFEADDLLGHMLAEVDRISREGPEATGSPAWAGIAARVLDGTILAPRATRDTNVAELTRRLDLAEKTIRDQGRRITTLSKKGGTG